MSREKYLYISLRYNPRPKLLNWQEMDEVDFMDEMDLVDEMDGRTQWTAIYVGLAENQQIILEERKESSEKKSNRKIPPPRAFVPNGRDSG